MAGNPPAAAFQPSGIKGMIVMVMIKVRQDPAAPRTPNSLFQKPKSKSAPNSHSDTPRNQLEPWTPKTGYIQEISGPFLKKESNLALRKGTTFGIQKRSK